MDITIQLIHQYCATILIIIFMYSSIIWFLFSDDVEKIQNNFLQLMLRLEMIISFAILILGGAILITEPSWFDEPLIFFKIILGIITVGLIHISSIKTKRFSQSENLTKDRKSINILRILAIIFLMTVFTLGMKIQTIVDCRDSNLIECKNYQ